MHCPFCAAMNAEYWPGLPCATWRCLVCRSRWAPQLIWVADGPRRQPVGRAAAAERLGWMLEVADADLGKRPILTYVDLLAGVGGAVLDGIHRGWVAYGVEPDPAAVRAGSDADPLLISRLLYGHSIWDMSDRASADVVSCFSGLTCLADPPTELERIADVLNDAGYLLLTTPLNPAPGTYVWLPAPEVLCRVAARLGLQLVASTERDTEAWQLFFRTSR